MPSEAVKAAIGAAISQGAPLYNAGFPDKCCQLYLDTALKLADGDTTTAAEAGALREAAQKASSLRNPSDGAWALRHAFDSILDGSLEARARLAALPPGTTEFPLLDFELGLPDAPRWFIMDDVIMGGASSSGMQYDAQERAAAFCGNVTADFGGGFASVRSQPWGGWAALGAGRGIRMCVKGDGRTYKLNAKADGDYDGIMYQHDFQTSDGTWQTVDLPFSEFKPNFRGRLVPNRPPLRGDQVRQIGFMVSKFSDVGGLTAGFRTGRFKLAVKWMRGFV